MNDEHKVRAHDSLGAWNRSAVLKTIVLKGPLSRTEISAEVGLTMATISRITGELIRAGLVRELSAEQAGAGIASEPAPVGRRPVSLDIDPQGGQVLGIGLGRSLQTVTLTDLKNQVIAGVDMYIDEIGDPDRVIGRLADESQRLLAAHLEDRRRLLGGFVMVAGFVDPIGGRVHRSSYLGWHDVPLGSRLAGLLDLPMKVESMSATIALSEMRFGVARGRDNVLVLVCGLGVSAGLILNERLVEGRNFEVGDVGQMEVITREHGVKTLDDIASGYYVLWSLLDDGVFSMSAGQQARALTAAIEHDRNGDPATAALMAEAGSQLGRFTAQFVRLVAPETVVVTGPLSLSPSYLAAVREAAAEGLAGLQVDVVAGTVTGPVSGRSATCGLAVCEYLFERTLDLSGLIDESP